ncbi:ATP-binding protein [Clostridiaceae bacterium]|nr:ATP-binding protein [Clostridiaceae bacterium]
MSMLSGLCLTIYSMAVIKIYMDAFIKPREGKWGAAGWLPFVVWNIILSSRVWEMDIKRMAVREHSGFHLLISFVIMEMTGFLAYQGERWKRLILPAVYMALWMMSECLALFGGTYIARREAASMAYVLISNMIMLMMALGLRDFVRRNEIAPALRGWRSGLALLPVAGVILYYAVYVIASEAGIYKPEVALWLSIIAFLLLALDLCIYPVYRKLLEAIHVKKDISDYQKQIRVYKNQRALEQEARENIERIRHDMKQELIYLEDLLRHQEYGRIQKTLSRLLGNLNEKSYLEGKTGNLAIDSQINHLWQECKKKRVCLHTDILLSGTPGMDDLEICVLLGNLFDNAVEASEKISRGREIWVEMAYSRGYFILLVSNRYAEKTKRDAKGFLMSGNGTRRAIGLQSVRRIADRYHGQMEVAEKGDIFAVEVMVYC